MTPAATRRSAASWAAAAGVATTPMLTRLVCTICGSSSMWRTRTPPSTDADLGRVDVDDAGDGEAALAEPAVAGERLAEVAGADDDDRPVVGQAELAADLVDEVVDLVADAAGAVAAEVAEVLADLGGVDAGQLGEPLGRDAVDTLVALLGEDPQVHRQPGNGGLGDPAACAFGSHTWTQTLGTRAHVHKAARRSDLTDFCHAARSRADARYRRGSMNAALAAAATLVAVGFALSTLDRWLRRRRPHELAWTVSLACSPSAPARCGGPRRAAGAWPTFRVFYLVGAVLNVPWLALGTVYLLAGRARRRPGAVVARAAQRVQRRRRAVRPDTQRRVGHRPADGQGGVRRRPACARRRRVRCGRRGDHRRRAVERVPAGAATRTPALPGVRQLSSSPAISWSATC